MCASNGHETRRSGRTSARILFVPGFVADTYSEIEKSFVELCSCSDSNVEYLWLVPDISCKLNTFAKPESRTMLKEPEWVPHLRKNNIPYVVGNISKYNVLSNFLLFCKIFRNNHIDAVYTHFGIERFWAAFFGKLLGKVTIWNEHWHSLGMRHSLAKRLFYRIFVDEFIAISRFVASTLPHNGRVHTIPNSIRSDIHRRLTESEAAALRRRLGIGEKDQVVLMVAQFTAQKRHFLALDIIQRVFRAQADVLFAFLGEGITRIPFLEKARELGLQHRIFAPGYVNDVASYYSIADVCILTSYNEGFGYAVLEAMRYGLPVVAFDTGGPADVIRNGRTGILVRDTDVDEFAQKLLDLINDGQLRTGIGERAREVIQVEFNREIWIRQLNSTLKDIVTGHQAQLSKRHRVNS